MSLYQPNSVEDVTINFIETIEIREEIVVKNDTLTFRGPPATLVVCATCGCKAVATEGNTSLVATSNGAAFKCPNCDQKYSVVASTVDTDISTTEAQITALQQVLKLLQDRLAQLKEIKKNVATCTACGQKWAIEAGDSLQECGYKCTDASCGGYNKVEKLSS